MSDLGFMKDEMSGLVLKEGCFLGIKKYGYQYYDRSNKLITKSVFAGVLRDSLTFEEIIKISNGESLVTKIPLRFYKSFQTLSISIYSTRVTISRSLDKVLKDNLYLPVHLDLTNHGNSNLYNYFKRKLLKFLKF